MYIYQKVIQYTVIVYTNNKYFLNILEIINFIVCKGIFLLNQLELSVFFILIFNIFYIVFLFFVIIFFFIFKGLNLDFYIKKKHIFKNRIKTKFIFNKHKKSTIQYLYSVKRCRIDLVSIRLFKKLLRRKFIKAKTRFFKPKYWVLMMPNFLLTQKSKNSRMGAGVGKFVRLTSIIQAGRAIIKT